MRNYLLSVAKLRSFVDQLIQGLSTRFGVISPIPLMTKQPSRMIMFLLPACVFFAIPADAQLYQQQFNSNFATVTNAPVTDANYISATPNASQLTYLASNTSGTNTITASGGTLQIINSGTGSGWAAARNVNFPGPPTTLKVSFDASIDVQSTGSNAKFSFYAGSGFSNTITTEANANIHSGFSIRYANGSYYYVKTLAGGGGETTTDRITDATTLSFTFVSNNSGAMITYIAPDGSNETLPDDTWDLWVGTTLRLDDQPATTAGQVLSQFKFGDLVTSSAGRANWILDNIIVESVAPLLAPTVLTTSATATGRYTGTGAGNITGGGSTAVTESGIVWSTTVNPDVALPTKTTNGPATGTFSHNITGLTAGTLISRSRLCDKFRWNELWRRPYIYNRGACCADPYHGADNWRYYLYC